MTEFGLFVLTIDVVFLEFDELSLFVNDDCTADLPFSVFEDELDELELPSVTVTVKDPEEALWFEDAASEIDIVAEPAATIETRPLPLIVTTDVSELA